MYKRKAPSAYKSAPFKKPRSVTYGPTSSRVAYALRGRVAKGYTRRAGFYGRFGGSGGEQKFFDTSVAFSFDLTGEVPATGQLVLIPQGVTESTRVGRKCVIKSIQLKGIIQLVPGASAQASTTVALYLMQDTQTNGAAAAAGDVFTGTNFPIALHNLSNSQRFKTLKKWTWTFNPPSGATTALSNVNRYMTYYKRLNVPIEYSSTTGAITEIRTNNIFLMAGADGNSDDLVSFSGNCRVRFTDN